MLLGARRTQLGGLENVAETDLLEPKFTEHAVVPAQPPPLHPVKRDPRAGVALSVTRLPIGKECEQADGQ